VEFEFAAHIAAHSSCTCWCSSSMISCSKEVGLTIIFWCA